MACRATDDAATASGPLRRRRRAARGAARRLEASRRAATASAGRRESPDRPPPARGPRRRRSRNFTSRARHPAPTRSEFTQIRKKNEPRPRLIDTTPVDTMTMAWRPKAPISTPVSGQSAFSSRLRGTM